MGLVGGLRNNKGVNTINVLDIYGRVVLQQKAIGGTKNIRGCLKIFIHFFVFFQNIVFIQQ